MRAAHRALFGFALAGCLFSCSPGSDEAEPVAEPELTPPVALAAVDSRPNAAAECRRIFASLDASLRDLIDNSDLDSPPTSSESALLASRQDVIKDLIAAIAIDRWDSGVDFSQGDFTTLLPHLGEARKFSKLLQADAHRFSTQPSGYKGCAERLAAIVRLAEHVGSEPGLISKLVSYACFSVATHSIRSWDLRLAQPEVKAHLRTALESARNSAAFDIRAAFEFELGAIKRSIEKSAGTVTVTDVPIRVSNEEKSQLIAEIDRLFQQIYPVCTASDAEQKIKAIVDNARVAKAKAFMGGFHTVPRSMRRIQSELDSAITSLR